MLEWKAYPMPRNVNGGDNHIIMNLSRLSKKSPARLRIVLNFKKARRIYHMLALLDIYLRVTTLPTYLDN